MSFAVHVFWIVLFSLPAAASDNSGEELHSDFSSPNWFQSFEPKRPAPWKQGMNRVSIVDDSDRKHPVLEVKYPKGGVGPTDCGAQWVAYLPHASNQMKVSYWIKFQKNFAFVLGGKLPGLIGGGASEDRERPVGGGIHPDGKNGWSARIMWKKNGEIIQYVYHMDQPGKWGDELKWRVRGGPAKFKPGVWQKVTTEITLNDPDKKNGRVRSWLDDELALDAANLRFRSTADLKIDALYFSTFFGGEDPDWAPPFDESIRFDEFRVFP